MNNRIVTFDVIQSMYKTVDVRLNWSSQDCVLPAGSWSEAGMKYERPTLFNIYINELAVALGRSSSIPGLALHDSEVKCLLYADDLVLLSPTSEGLQHSLALQEQYCEEWALMLNLDKTRVTVFQKKARSQGNRYQLSYEGEVLEHSTSYSYLGIQISALGGFSLAVKALHEKARRAFYAIKSRFGQLKLPIKTWVKLSRNH